MSHHWYMHCALALSLAACAGQTGGETDPGETDGPDTSTTDGPAPACVEDDFMAQPFAGPGFDPENGGLQEPLQDSYLATTTLLAIHPEKAQEFTALVGAMIPVLSANPGLVGFSLGSSAKCGTARTLAVWRDQEAMMNFVVSPEHVAGMNQATELSVTGTVTSWEVPRDEVPIDWDTARARVAEATPSY